eukprot:2763263-Amphidinium_carterae.2
MACDKAKHTGTRNAQPSVCVCVCVCVRAVLCHVSRALGTIPHVIAQSSTGLMCSMQALKGEGLAILHHLSDAERKNESCKPQVDWEGGVLMVGC